ETREQSENPPRRLPNFRWRIIPAFLLLLYGIGAIFVIPFGIAMWFINPRYRDNPLVTIGALPFVTAFAVVTLKAAKTWMEGRWRAGGGWTAGTVLLGTIAGAISNATGLFR